MKLQLILIGKTTESYLQEGMDVYMNRLKHYCHVEMTVIPSPKHASKLNPQQLKTEEGKLMLNKIAPRETVILLDERGTQVTSKGLAEKMNSWMNSGQKTINLLIGGAYGFSPEVYERANAQLALSKMTFSHQMVRLILLEQLYRAFSILQGEKYHHA